MRQLHLEILLSNKPEIHRLPLPVALQRVVKFDVKFLHDLRKEFRHLKQRNVLPEAVARPDTKLNRANG